MVKPISTNFESLIKTNSDPMRLGNFHNDSKKPHTKKVVSFDVTSNEDSFEIVGEEPLTFQSLLNGNKKI